MIMEDKNTGIIKIDTPQNNYDLVEGHDQIGWDEKFIDTETIKNCRRCGAKYDIDKDTWTFTTIKPPKHTNVVHETADHKWGQHMYLFNNNFVMIKLLQIEANQETEYVYHEKHDEYIMVASGEASLILDGEEMLLKAGDSVKIFKNQKHRIKNNTEEKLLIVEHWFDGEFDHDDQVIIN